MTNTLNIKYDRGPEGVVIASAEGMSIGRKTLEEATVDLLRAFEAVNGPLLPEEAAKAAPASASAVWIPRTAPDGGIRSTLALAIEEERAVYIEGTHKDGSYMQSRVIQPQIIQGDTVGGIDSLSNEYRNFHIPSLSVVEFYGRASVGGGRYRQQTAKEGR